MSIMKHLEKEYQGISITSDKNIGILQTAFQNTLDKLYKDEKLPKMTVEVSKSDDPMKVNTKFQRV